MARKKTLTVTRVEAAEICGLSPRQFDEVIRPRAKDATTGRGASLRFNLRPIVAALVEYRIEQLKPPVAPSGIILNASPEELASLDRLRLANAQIAELELGERRASLVRLTVISDALRPALAAMRSTGDRLARRFGNDACEIFNEGICDFEAAALRMIERPNAADADKLASDSPLGRADSLPPGRNDDAQPQATGHGRVRRKRNHRPRG